MFEKKYENLQRDTTITPQIIMNLLVNTASKCSRLLITAKEKSLIHLSAQF